MNTLFRILLFAVLLLFLSKCDSKSPSQEADNPNSLPSYGTYTFNINRVADHPPVQFPSDTLSESNYKLDTSGKKYEVKFLSAGDQISIQQDSITGSKSFSNNLQIKYNCIHGLFAGGRFLIWLKNQSLEAEFTVYGSGVPIIKSERGTLLKK